MPMQTRLDGQQVAQICDALVTAFDRSDLRALTRIELDQELDAIAGGETMPDLALSLVDWAEDNGRVPDLIAAMQRRNPTNPAVQALVQASAAWFRPGAPARRPAPAAPQQPAPSAAARGAAPARWIAALLVFGLLGCGAIFAVARFGNLLPASAGATPAAAAAVPAQAIAATVAAAAAGEIEAAPTAQPNAAAAPSPVTALAITAPGQDWNLGTRVYRILSASAAQLNPAQTQIDLQVRMTNNGLADDMLTGADMQLLDGVTTYPDAADMAECYKLVSRAAARDECHLRFVVNGAPAALTLCLQARDAQVDVPLTLGGPLGAGVATPSPPAGALAVEAPAGVWPVEQSIYQVVAAELRPYDADRTAVTFHIAMTNNAPASSPLWGSSMRLLVDGVPRAPEDDWNTTCFGIVDAAQSSDRCTVTFVVPNAVADLKLRFLNLDRGVEATVPLTVGHAAP